MNVGGLSYHCVPYPTPQQAVPEQWTYLSSADAAPGPGYSAVSRHFTPPGIQGSHNLAPLFAGGFDGRGKTIAIVDSFGYDQAAADLETFSQATDSPRIPHDKVAKMTNSCHKALSQGHCRSRAESFESSLRHSCESASPTSG